MYNGSDRKWKEAVMSPLKVLSRHLTGAIEENHKKTSISWSASRDLTSGPTLIRIFDLTIMNFFLDTTENFHKRP
jgi:hypothetical protein